ncbi:hypothetical protein [Paraburkholderia aromaticivorans]
MTGSTDALGDWNMKQHSQIYWRAAASNTTTPAKTRAAARRKRTCRATAIVRSMCRLRAALR